MNSIVSAPLCWLLLIGALECSIVVAAELYIRNLPGFLSQLETTMKSPSYLVWGSLVGHYKPKDFHIYYAKEGVLIAALCLV